MTALNLIVLVALAAVLAGLYRAPGEATGTAPPPAPERARETGVVVPSFEPPSLGTLSATVERPLFSPGRRPPAVEVPVAAPAPPPTVSTASAHGHRLTGIVLDGEDRVALVQEPGSGKGLRVREGDRLGDWEIVTISDQSLVLVAGDEREVMKLRDYPPAPSPPTPRERAEKPAGAVPAATGARTPVARQPAGAGPAGEPSAPAVARQAPQRAD